MVKTKYFLIKLIEMYQATPIHSHNNCRFIPTCSEYTKQSIEEYGAFKGSIYGIKRILRCRPFGDFGYDPVNKRNEEIK